MNHARTVTNIVIKKVTFNRRFSVLKNSNQSQWRKNGTPEILVGGSILTLLGLDYILQKQQDTQRKKLMYNLEAAIRQDEQQNTPENCLSNRPVIFQCIVKRIPNLFDGSKCLKGVKIGDKVGVIEEGVGPGGMYNLCIVQVEGKQSNDARDRIGIFPIQCLEKIQ